MARLGALLTVVFAAAASAGEVVIDDFEGEVAWTHNEDGGVHSRVRADSEHVKTGRGALRITYADSPPQWSNIARAVTVPPDASAVAVWIRVHSMAPGAAMHLWLFEADGDAWLARLFPPPGGSDPAPEGGWRNVVVPVGAFAFQPRGNHDRAMTSANRMLIGCNFADVDVTLDGLRFIVSEEARVSELPRTRGLRFEGGRRGRVAILAERLPGSAGSARPERIAELARSMGYGVTLLRAGDAADPAVLTRENADVLVVPCAPAYPREGAKALVGYLKGGGSLVSIGGYAFDEPVVWSGDGWSAVDAGIRAREMDSAREQAAWRLNTRHGGHGDTMKLDPGQIGAFDPSYVLEHVAGARAAPGQEIVAADVRIDAPLEGYAACAMTGSNNPVFPDVHGRWIPVLDAHDSLGRLRGAVASVVHHWAGPFAGSSWALFGATNRDVVGEGAAGRALLEGALRAVIEKTYLHGLATEWACYRRGEAVRASVRLTNRGRAARELVVRFAGAGLEAAERAVTVAPGETKPVEARVHGGAFDRDFYTLTAELAEAGRRGLRGPIDRMETAFVVWDEKVVRAGPRIAFRDNYFTWNGEPRFVCGTNQTGMMWYSEHEDPLVWERDLAGMESSALRVLRILHFSPFADPEDPKAWGRKGVSVMKDRPEKLLRQTDAIVQLAQKHGVVVFLTFHDWMPVELSDAELEVQRDWARFWTARYRDVPGIIYDVQNEPSVGFSQSPDVVRFHNERLRARYGTWEALREAWGGSAPGGEPWTVKPEAGGGEWADVKALDANRFLAAALDRWAEANVRGAKAGDPDALVTVGYLPHFRPADKVLGVERTDFSDMHYYGSIDRFPAELKIIDRRFAGKTLSLGEFGAQEAHDARTNGRTGTEDDASVRRFLATTHYTLGLGGAFALSWDWKDFDDCVFPWGLAHPCDLVPKPVLTAFRNTGLFLERLRPRYEDPGLWLLLPDSHRLGGRWNEVHAAISRTIDALVAMHVDFNVANEYDLGEVPETCRAIAWPVPYCPEDAAFDRVLAFVRRGGALYFSGDVAYDHLRRRTRAGRFAALGLRDPGERVPFAPGWEGAPGGIRRSSLGRGKVIHNPRPAELLGAPDAAALGELLAAAGIERNAVEPDDARVHVFRVPLVDGEATVVVNRAGADRRLELAKAEIAVGRELTGLVATTRAGDVTGVECTGESAAGGRPITSGEAHVMVMSLDGADVRRSARIAVYPVTAGALAIHTTARWRSPVLDVGEMEGSRWRSLETRSLRVEGGKIAMTIDDALLRSLLVIREQADAR